MHEIWEKVLLSSWSWRLKKGDQSIALSAVAYRKCLINMSEIKANKVFRNLATSFSRDQT